MERKQFLLSGLMASLALTGFAKPHLSSSHGSLEPFYIPPDVEPLDHGGGLAIRMKVRSKQTNSQYSCVDVAIAPKTMGPSPHVHEALEELMYVHEGVVNVLVGKEIFEVKAGGWHLRPRGVPHTFWNATDKPARCTDMYFNQNFDDFLEELFFKIIPDMVKRKVPPTDPQIAGRMEKLNKKFGVTMHHDQRQWIIDKYGLKG
jgi:mannose-6-phosphate isomerase-like protein (cupin superfamily)